MKKTILFAALAATTLAGSALAQTTTTQPGAMPTPSTTAPSTTAPSTMPSTTGSTPNAPAGHTGAVLIDRQKAGEAMSSELVGAAVYTATGERVGDVNDLVIDGSGRISGVVIGVGGFLGMGEKNVAVDYTSVLKSKDDSGRARLTVNLTKDVLKTATPFVPVKKS